MMIIVAGLLMLALHVNSLEMSNKHERKWVSDSLTPLFMPAVSRSRYLARKSAKLDLKC